MHSLWLQLEVTLVFFFFFAVRKQVTTKENDPGLSTKMWSVSVSVHHSFLVCNARPMLPSFPTIPILPFSLHHLSHTQVRMSMTQQGHCFVVLFYLFLDNEKSAEGLAWCSLPHIFTHETLPRPYGSSAGGYLTLLTPWHQKRWSWSLSFRGLSWIQHYDASRLKENTCIFFFFAMSPPGAFFYLLR